MGRKQKFEGSVISLRIPVDCERDYSSLLKDIVALRKSVQVYKGTGMALTQYSSKTGFGTLSRFSIIDLEGDWFDESGFGPAGDEDLKRILIPGHLKPNLVGFPIFLDEKEHLLAVLIYFEGNSLSILQVEKFLRAIVELDEIYDKYGSVQVDIFKDSEEIEALMELETLREIKVTIRRPNHIPPGLIRSIEEELHDENATELERTVRAKSGDYLEPSNTTKALGVMAAENGEVTVKYEDDGAVIKTTSAIKPYRKKIITDDPESTTRGVFTKIKNFLIGRVKASRQKAEQVAAGE